MFNQNNIEKLKRIVTYLGLGRTREIRNFFDNLKKQPPLDDLAIKQNLNLFEALVYDKAFDLISTDVIRTDKYGFEFFNLIEELKFKHIQSLLLKKGFQSSFFNTLAKTPEFFNIPEELKPSKMETLLEQPLDLSRTGPLAFSSKT